MIQILSFTIFEEVFHWTHWGSYLVSLVLIMTMIINFVTEYSYDRFFVFGKSIDTAKKIIMK